MISITKNIPTLHNTPNRDANAELYCASQPTFGMDWTNFGGNTESK